MGGTCWTIGFFLMCLGYVGWMFVRLGVWYEDSNCSAALGFRIWCACVRDIERDWCFCLIWMDVDVLGGDHNSTPATPLIGINHPFTTPYETTQALPKPPPPSCLPATRPHTPLSPSPQPPPLLTPPPPQNSPSQPQINPKPPDSKHQAPPPPGLSSHYRQSRSHHYPFHSTHP